MNGPEQDKPNSPGSDFSFRQSLEEISAESSTDLGPQVGHAQEPSAQEVKIRENETVEVAMNAASFAVVGPGETATMSTKSLAGCTGIAGIATGPEGSLLGVSHFDPMVDRLQRIHAGGSGGATGDSPSLRFLYDYAQKARSSEPTEIQIAIVYDQMNEHNPDYQSRKGHYETWHFLDQLQTAAEELAKQGIEVTLVPYQSGDGQTLTVSTEHPEGTTGITLDGNPIEKTSDDPQK